jgi:hypothetical protein
MSYKPIEVDLDHGTVRPSGSETLPSHGHGLLMLFPTGPAAPARSCAELAKWWEARSRLPESEAASFADDIEAGRRQVGPLKSAWD